MSALVTPDKEAEATAAGADFVGLDEYLDKIKGGWTDVDVIVTMPSVMGTELWPIEGLEITSEKLCGKLSMSARALIRNASQEEPEDIPVPTRVEHCAVDRSSRTHCNFIVIFFLKFEL